MTLLADSGIEYELGIWIDDLYNGKLGVQSDLNHVIYRRFKEAGIDIPYLQWEVRMRGTSALQQGILCISSDVTAPSIPPLSD